MMGELTFWLLDLNYDTSPQKPIMWLWGITREGRRVLVVDPHETPRLYLIPENDNDPEPLLKEIEKRGQALKTFLTASITEKVWKGKRHTVIEVKTTAVDTTSLTRLARQLSKGLSLQPAGNDLRWTVQYLVYQNLTTATWWTVNTEACDAGQYRLPVIPSIDLYAVQPGYRPIQNRDDVSLPPLKIIVWDALPWQSDGLMLPERDPIVIAGIDDGQDSFIFFGENEKSILKQFLETWHKIDPDVVFGFDVNRFLWPYLLERYHQNDLTPGFGRDGTSPHPSLYGHYSVTGRAGIDVLDFVQEIPDIKYPGIPATAQFLGLDDIPEDWDDLTWVHTWQEDRDRAMAWFRKRLRTLWFIASEFWPYAVSLSRLTGIPLDHVITSAAGFRVDHVLMNAASQRNEIPPPRKDQPFYPSYAGGLVMAPKPGIHENVAVLDFKSMYPTIMMLYNISPDTLVRSDASTDENDTFTSPTTGHRFRKHPDGLFRKVIKELIRAREHVREQRTKTSQESAEYKALLAEEKAVKVLTNAVYGYAGWPGARWYSREVAEACADWGRWTIQQTLNKAKELGLKVIYGDTDSLFVVHDPDKVNTLIQWVDRELHMTIELETIYRRILFTEAKKRYAGWTLDGKLDIVGLEAVRGDWAPIVQEIQEAVLLAILRDNDTEKARRIYQQSIKNLLEGKVSWSKLVIWKTLTRKIDDYKTMTPHVAAARTLMERGHRVPIGYKVGYAVLKGKGALYKRVAPFPYIPTDRLDTEYYIEKQVRPAIERILTVAEHAS